MARTSHLAQRIERLLNESSFRQAFAAGGRRAMLAVFLVPVALFASASGSAVAPAIPTIACLLVCARLLNCGMKTVVAHRAGRQVR